MIVARPDDDCLGAPLPVTSMQDRHDVAIRAERGRDRSRLWFLIAGGVFAAINLGGAVIAAVRGELAHTLTHVGLLVATYGVWQFALRRARQSEPAAELAGQQLDRLEQSVDTIALQMERIGEAQRFMVNVQQERLESRD